MNTKEYLEYVVKEIHTVIVATVDDDGLPVTSAIDMMDADEGGIEHRMHILILSEDIKVFIFCILNSVWVQTLL